MSIEKYCADNLADYYDLLRFKTIAAQDIGIEQTSEWLLEKFKQLGATNVERWELRGAAPVVFAEFDANKDKTVLFYNHYDTQPAEPLDRWTSDPYEPVIRDGKIFARGISDDKGELIARLLLVQYLQAKDELPVNVKFFVEGEEEIGSAHINEYIAAHHAELSADVCIWEGGGKNETEKFQITGGLRGIAAFEISVETADYDLHSSLASYAESAPWRLVQGLASLRDTQGNILVDDFYADADQLTDNEEAILATNSFDQAEVYQTTGLKRPFLTPDPKRALVNGATLTINGLTSGYQEEGVKTVLPRFASAKLDCRLTPNQDPKRVAKAIQTQLEKNGFEDLKVHYLVGQKGFRTDLNSKYAKTSFAVAQRIYGAEQVCYLPNASGAGPAYAFGDGLNLPVLSVGVGYAKSNDHGADENIRLDDLLQGTRYLSELLVEFADQV